MIDLLFYGPFVQKLLHNKNFDIFHHSSSTLSPLENSLCVEKKNHNPINCGASLLGVFFLSAREVKCWRPLVAVYHVYFGEVHAAYIGWCRPPVLDVTYPTNRIRAWRGARNQG
jgi:hypothetical protein